MKRSRGATSVELQPEEEQLSFKNPRSESEDDLVFQVEETEQSQSTASSTSYDTFFQKDATHSNTVDTRAVSICGDTLQDDHSHIAILQDNHAYPRVWPPCNTSNQQFLKKTKLGFNVDYYPCFLKVSLARTIFNQLEEELSTYLSASRNEVVLMGKVHKIPRKHTAFGDPGLVYKFSGVCVSANPWIPILESLRDLLTSVLGERFNFVLVNRYEDGRDHIGEHRDDASDLAARSPIAALSLGQRRDFVFKHRDSRGSKGMRKDIDVVKLCLEHGSLLVMNFPTNVYWYHSLPMRKSVLGTRISLTYRVMKMQT